MIKRRQFNAALLGTFVAAMPGIASGRPVAPSSIYHASVGRRLFAYRIDVSRGRLLQVGDAVSAPEAIQFGWAHPVRNLLYVASSDQKSGRHFLSAFSIDDEGRPTPFGPSAQLSARPINLTVDHEGRFILVAYNSPSGVTVHRIGEDGGIAELVPQSAALETGVYPHQIRVMPSNNAVLVPARGNDPKASAAEDPGSLRVFSFKDGQLSNAQTVSPGGGLDFRPRHADFAPSGGWAYLTLESQNMMQTYRITDDRLSDDPLYAASTLDPAQPAKRGQLASAIRVHPNGGHVYVANRGTGTEKLDDGRRVIIGENTIAVFAINQATGEPAMIQRIDTRGVHARAMDISADGQWLVAGSIRPALVRDGDSIVTSPAGLTVFRVQPDGRLRYAEKLDIDTGGDSVFWVGAWR